MIKAKDFMTKEVVTIQPEATVEELARLLIDHNISGVPVVDKDNNLLGIVTENDLISQNKRLHIPGEICVKDVVSITEDTTLQEVATLMSEKNIHTLPVLRDKVVVGIAGKADIVRAMTQDAAQSK
jgi:CBS domain-containing protein